MAGGRVRKLVSAKPCRIGKTRARHSQHLLVLRYVCARVCQRPSSWPCLVQIDVPVHEGDPEVLDLILGFCVSPNLELLQVSLTFMSETLAGGPRRRDQPQEGQPPHKR
jgi:hypothetical protein